MFACPHTVSRKSVPRYWGTWRKLARRARCHRDGGHHDIFVYRPGEDSIPAPLLADDFDEFEPDVSPDGRWLAYVSDETGRPEVFVRPFPEVGGGKWQISSDGGTDPLWNPNGRELFFRSVDGFVIMEADLTDGPQNVRPEVLIQLPAVDGDQYERNGTDRLFDVAPDGQHFYLIRQTGGDRSGEPVVVQNVFEELKGVGRCAVSC